MKLSHTLKAAALSAGLLAIQPGCAVNTDMCEINGTDPNGAVMENVAEVKEFCHYYHDAIITCVETSRGCPISNASTTSCSDLQNNQIFTDAAEMARLNGTFFMTCVEGKGYIPTKE